jgi:ribosomal protein S18 acetylase RimI-like enzyme
MEEFYAETRFPFDGDAARRAFSQLLDDDSLGCVWLAEVERTAVGYIVMTLGFSMEFAGRDAFVDDLFVRAAQRGGGFGSALLDTLISECRRRDVRAVHLEVAPDNPRAKRLYASRGFRDRGLELIVLRLNVQ